MIPTWKRASHRTEQPLHEEMSRDRHTTGVGTNGGTARERAVDRMTVPEAAEIMGVTQSAIRKRVQRGTIPWDKDHEGRVYVYVDPSERSSGTGKDRDRDRATGRSRDEVLEAYKDQVEFLRRELERKDMLLASLTQRIPELEVSSEAREPSGKPPADTAKGDAAPPEQQAASQRPSWWRRFFGFE
jgi:hypothetical protein